MHKYPVRIFWWEEDNAWVAVCPAFPYISASGSTREDAAREIDDAIAEAVFNFEAEGKPLPEVAREPVASGQIRLRLPRTVHDRAVDRAQVDEVSLNTFLVGAVTERLGVAGALAEVRALRDEIVGLLAEQNAVIERLLKD
jgi:predicted RNase H-like HicB family nuclease